MNLKKIITPVVLSSVVGLLLVGCSPSGSKVDNSALDLNALSVEQLEVKAKEEGHIESVGMPDSWANWVETWADIEAKYGITHKDTDMSSAEELAIFKSEQNNPTKDIGDVGQSFGPQAEEQGLTIPYKTSYWDEIPSWAKDDDGDWMVAYTGTIAFLTNTAKVDNPPQSWDDILEGDYKVTIGDPTSATQSQNAILAAAIANGGDETNIQPGIDFFAKLAEQGRLDMGSGDLSRLESGEISVGLYWDFNALNYKNSIESQNKNIGFVVSIPSDGSVQSGYATIINSTAPHPHAAALAREYIFSDKGQINLAKGYARPIRENVELPAEVQEILLPAEDYKAAKPIVDKAAWEETASTIGQKWQNEVITKVK